MHWIGNDASELAISAAAYFVGKTSDEEVGCLVFFQGKMVVYARLKSILSGTVRERHTLDLLLIWCFWYILINSLLYMRHTQCIDRFRWITLLWNKDHEILLNTCHIYFSSCHIYTFYIKVMTKQFWWYLWYQTGNVLPHVWGDPFARLLVASLAFPVSVFCLTNTFYGAIYFLSS